MFSTREVIDAERRAIIEKVVQGTGADEQ